jgi:pachytene checkpoint protein 2
LYLLDAMIVHVEVEIYRLCPIPLETLGLEWNKLISSDAFQPDSEGVLAPDQIPPPLRSTCCQVRLFADAEIGSDDAWKEPTSGRTFRLHLYVMSDEAPCMEELEPASSGDDEFVPACENWTLPNKAFEGLWDTLIVQGDTKEALLHYAETGIYFSSQHVSSNVVSWNRLLLLHGPPGTGKTSLCKALAQKLAIRLNFPKTQLLEIQSHALFSKWFSTSGKLIQRLFELIREMVQDDPNTLICVLIDEIESLASSRSASNSGDPTDAMRAVNALLTSLDKLKSFPNLLVMGTTNLKGRLDEALVDRADLKVYLGNPIVEARFEILKSCLLELMRAGIIVDEVVPDFASATEKHVLNECARLTNGWSGRALRRLPLQAHARFVRRSHAVTLQEFLEGLLQGVREELVSRRDMKGLVPPTDES